MESTLVRSCRNCGNDARHHGKVVSECMVKKGLACTSAPLLATSFHMAQTDPDVPVGDYWIPRTTPAETLTGCEKCVNCPKDAKKGDLCPAGVTRSWSVDFGVIGNWYIDGAAKECEKFEMIVTENDEIGFYSLFRNYTIPQSTENALFLYQTPDNKILAIPFTKHDLQFEKIPFPLNENLVYKIMNSTDENMKMAQKMNLLTSYVRKMKHSKNKHIRKLYKEKIIVEFGFDVDVKKKVS